MARRPRSMESMFGEAFIALEIFISEGPSDSVCSRYSLSAPFLKNAVVFRITAFESLRPFQWHLHT